MSDIAPALLLLLGAALLLLAAIGLIRMPDIYTRLSVASKAVALGTTSMFVAVALEIPDLGVKTRAVAGILFFIITAPVAAHMLARAAAHVGRPLWEGTVVDEMRIGVHIHEPEGTEPADGPPDGGVEPSSSAGDRSP